MSVYACKKITYARWRSCSPCHCQSSVDYGNNKITQHAPKRVSLHNVEVGHYTKEEEEPCSRIGHSLSEDIKLHIIIDYLEIMSREVELGWESWTSFASSCPSCSSTAVQRTWSLWLCPSTAVETAIAQCTSRWEMARGHRLNTSIVLAAVHGLLGLPDRWTRSSLHSSAPSASPVPNRPPRLCGRKAKCSLCSHGVLAGVGVLWHSPTHDGALRGVIFIVVIRRSACYAHLLRVRQGNPTRRSVIAL